MNEKNTPSLNPKYEGFSAVRRSTCPGESRAKLCACPGEALACPGEALAKGEALACPGEVLSVGIFDNLDSSTRSTRSTPVWRNLHRCSEQAQDYLRGHVGLMQKLILGRDIPLSQLDLSKFYVSDILKFKNYENFLNELSFIYM